MLKLGRSSQEKIDFAVELLKAGKPYREIQKQLKKKFNSSMSFSTLTKLKNIHTKTMEQSDRITRVEQELELFKKLYFDLLEEVKQSKLEPSLSTKLSPEKTEPEDTNNENKKS